MNKKFTLTRLALAVASMALQQFAIWAVFSWLWPVYVGAMIGVMVGWLVTGTCIFIFTTNILKKQKPIGQTSMVGAVGKVVGALTPEGMVKIRGELWGAISEEGEITAGEGIIVIGEKGLKLLVRKNPGGATR
jgi:membrane-bound ClpP family serine protease